MSENAITYICAALGVAVMLGLNFLYGAEKGFYGGAIGGAIGATAGVFLASIINRIRNR